MKRVAIDTVTIHAGHGGSGGGIWTYTRQLLLHLDQLAADYPQLGFYCLINAQFDVALRHIQTILVTSDTRKLPARMQYLHLTLPALCRKHHIDLLHRLTPEIPFRIGIPVVATLHDFMAEFYERTGRHTGAGLVDTWRNRYFFATKKFALRHSKAICTPSEAIRTEAIHRFGGDPNRVFVTELAAQMPPEHYVRQRNTNGPVTFYTVAAFHPHKGHLNCIAIFEALIQQTGMDARLFFRGNIQDRAAFATVEQRIQQSPVKDRIAIIPFDRNSTLGDIYNHADFLLLLSEYEGFGLPVLEAQAYGIPLVCSDIPTFKEVAAESAFYLNDTRPQEAAASLALLVNNTPLQAQLVQKGLQNVRRFSWALTAQKTASVYHHALQIPLPANRILQQVPMHSTQ